jgi:MoxR-like ATPase
MPEHLARLRDNIDSVFFGKPATVNQLLIGLISRGHILIEDAPGVGKTVLARALSKSLDLSFNRVQLTPDLLPSDLIGVSVYNTKTGTFEFQKGPVFAHVVLADEINRTTPRTQSALLEAMSEYQVSVDGRTLPLEQPFLVIATQNPFEFEGTYFLPENQLDRFSLRIRIGYPDRHTESQIIRQDPSRTNLDSLEPVMNRRELVALQEYVPQIRVDESLIEYALDLVEVTRTHDQLEVGVSPRGTLAFIRCAQAAAVLSGRDYVVPDDLKSLFVTTCAHRVVTKGFVHDGQPLSAEQILHDILRHVTVPE